MASLLLLKIYGADPRYLVDSDEIQRLKEDPENDHCRDHGNDIKEERKQNGLQMAKNFYKSLLDPNQ